MSRYVIEGVWSGYTSQQSHVVHRTAHKSSEANLRVWAEKNRGISYTDGTWLYLTVRDCEPKEMVKEIHGYDSLIRDCVHYDTVSVAELERKRKEAQGK